MTFDMTKCKVGDKLKTRGGSSDELVDIDDLECDHPYAGKLCTYTTNGTVYKYGIHEDDIIGFWEEDEEVYPSIEVRTPQIEKITTYRVHFNEMFHRDLSEEEAVAIYQQLKELLGEK